MLSCASDNYPWEIQYGFVVTSSQNSAEHFRRSCVERGTWCSCTRCFDLVILKNHGQKKLQGSPQPSSPAPRVENPCEVKSGALPICSLAQDLEHPGDEGPVAPVTHLKM